MVTNPLKTPGEDLALNLHDLEHGYHIDSAYRPILHEMTLTVQAAEFIALLGPSGCGKSTLLRLIAGLEKPATSWIEVDGRPITGSGPDTLPMANRAAEYRALTGYLRKKNKQAVEEAIRLVGLTGFETAWPHQLSSGMAQRTAMARALVNHPRMLILDEPLGKLDALTRLTMQTELHKLWKERDFTAIMVTHDVDEALFWQHAS